MQTREEIYKAKLMKQTECVFTWLSLDCTTSAYGFHGIKRSETVPKVKGKWSQKKESNSMGCTFKTTTYIHSSLEDSFGVVEISLSYYLPTASHMAKEIIAERTRMALQLCRKQEPRERFQSSDSAPPHGRHAGKVN